jgi:hypothetical protein
MEELLMDSSQFLSQQSGEEFEVHRQTEYGITDRSSEVRFGPLPVIRQADIKRRLSAA